MGQNLKIIPLLIVVAMLSLSVRMVEMFYNASEISGVAHAELEIVAEEEKPDAERGVASEDGVPHEEAAMEDEPVGDSAAGQNNEAADTSVWRDPADESPGYAAVRREVYDDLVGRRERLDEREKALNTKEALLKAAEKELGQKYKEMEQLRGEIENLLDQQSEEEKARVASLVKVYEGMKPKDAARIFDTLDLDILVSVVSEMSERKLSPVLAAMDPERARTVTIMLAEQKKLPSLP